MHPRNVESLCSLNPLAVLLPFHALTIVKALTTHPLFPAPSYRRQLPAQLRTAAGTLTVTVFNIIHRNDTHGIGITVAFPFCANTIHDILGTTKGQ